MTTAVSKIMTEVADREAIRECLYRYCRGVDRLDAEMVRAPIGPTWLTRISGSGETSRNSSHGRSQKCAQWIKVSISYAMS